MPVRLAVYQFCVITILSYRYEQEKNDYERRLQERINGDRSATRYTQTINWALKNKEVRVRQCGFRSSFLIVHREKPLADDLVE